MSTTTATGTATNVHDAEKGNSTFRHNAPHAGPDSGAPRGRALGNPDEDPTSWVPRLPGHRLGNPGPL
jgi:hypothetical protein